MDINKIISNSIEKEKKKIRMDEDLFDKNWSVIHKKINTTDRKKQKKRVVYLKEISAVAAFVAILILIPPITQHYNSKNTKLPNDNATTINNNIDANKNIDTERSKQIKIEEYDKTLGPINVNGDYKEQKRAEEVAAQIAKKYYDNFIISYMGLGKLGNSNNKVLYHDFEIYEITKGKRPKRIKISVKQDTDQVYIYSRDEKEFVQLTDNFKPDNIEGSFQIDNESAKTLIDNKIEFDDLRSSIVIGENHYYSFVDKNTGIEYGVNCDTQDIYKINNNNIEELVYKNQLNNKKVTVEYNDDINGDDKLESIKYDYYNHTLTVNDMSIVIMDGIERGKISILDINKEDSMKALVLKTSGGELGSIYLYYFNGTTFVAKHRFTGRDMSTDGTGTFELIDSPAATLQCWTNNKLYKLTDNYAFEAIPQQYELNQKLTVKKSLSLQKSKTDKEIVATLQPGENIELVKTDDAHWYSVRSSKGIIGWFEVDVYKVKELNLFSRDVFDGLIFED